jgi:His-Xaa-Ser system radical SAM maturase HxsC
VIPLKLRAMSEASAAHVVRLRNEKDQRFDEAHDAILIEENASTALYSSFAGLLQIEGISAEELNGDVLLVDPINFRIDRLVRANSDHNTLLVTERCDQLCVMCSQPPKKTHVDRFDALTQAALLAPSNSVIGITGGEPTLYKSALLRMISRVLTDRPDVRLHVLTNAQHFEHSDVELLASPGFERVQWGIPLYAGDAKLHDQIVGKEGAFERLQQSFVYLMRAGANVELRTVLLMTNVDELPHLAKYVVNRLSFVNTWSIMQLENIGFARARWSKLYVDHSTRFDEVAEALQFAILHGVRARLFNFARCTVPQAFREYAVPSISDWKRRYAKACEQCSERDRCCGFFEWHPGPDSVGVTPL